MKGVESTFFVSDINYLKFPGQAGRRQISFCGVLCNLDPHVAALLRMTKTYFLPLFINGKLAKLPNEQSKQQEIIFTMAKTKLKVGPSSSMN